ncbi:MAG: PDDEXK nuclease domain-containing protein [Propionibacteriaceae bacterium]|jgi:predicted nuclease of restriction endonuclease-like (RecB) superfamily|nr:PDDEXK nuclease domain-containing protein [Propionibacteriaceae bacterium]
MTDLTPVPDEGPLGDKGLFEAASHLIEDAGAAVAHHANAVSVLRNWRLGRLIDVEMLHRGRADYGKQILATLSQELTAKHGSGYDPSNLSRMVTFAKTYPEKILATLSQELSWSHVRELLPLQTAEARAFYAGEVAAKRLGVRELRDAIGRKAYERRGIANSQIPPGSAMPLDIFSDPTMLHMLGLKDSYAEADLEQAILRDLESFLLEVGQGFTFAGRQVRMPFGDRDYHLDLLFYSRPLRRLVAVELKIGKFLPEYEGQMRFYLKWLDNNERGTDEDAPIGLILCTAADRDAIEMMELHKDNIVVAEYWTELLPKKQLEDRLKVLLREAQERVSRRALPAVAEPDEED